MKALEFIDTVKEFSDGRKTKRVIDELNVSIDKGKMVAVVGPSGSGKSTFLSMAGALLSPTSGDIKLAGQSIVGLNQKELTQRRLEDIGFIFQGSNLISYLKTYEQLQWVRKIAKLPKEADQKSEELLKQLGLEDVLEAYPDTLSGGEKQRVAVARAFINDPELILADEPTASIDGEKGRQVVEMIGDLVHDRQKAAIIVTHDDRILDLMDDIYHLEEGKLRKE